jgi:hypothetical protein
LVWGDIRADDDLFMATALQALRIAKAPGGATALLPQPRDVTTT